MVKHKACELKEHGKPDQFDAIWIQQEMEVNAPTVVPEQQSDQISLNLLRRGNL